MEAAGDELSFGNKSIFMVQVKQDQEFGVDQAEFGRYSTNLSDKILKREESRVAKWHAMLKKIDKLIQKQDANLKSRVRKGIPIGLRHSVWPVLCSFETLRAEKDFDYGLLAKTLEYQYKEMIELDVKRVCETESIAAMNIKETAVMRILKAISIAYPDVGYSSGMHSLAVFFHSILSEEDCFWMFVYLYESREMKKYFASRKAHKRNFFVFDCLAKEEIPKIATAIEKIGIKSSHYLNEYFFCFFTGTLDFQLCARIFDIFIFENEKILFRASLAILRLGQKLITTKKDYVEVFSALKDPSIFMKVDADGFVDACMKFRFGQKTVEEFHGEYLKTQY